MLCSLLFATSFFLSISENGALYMHMIVHVYTLYVEHANIITVIFASTSIVHIIV